MNILLVGCGAVGLSLASALVTAGAEVSLAAQGRTAEAIRQSGIARRGILGCADIPPESIRVFDGAGEAPGGYDTVIISVKTTANADVADALGRRTNNLLAPGGRIVLFQNGYGNERAYLPYFDPDQIYHASFAIGFKRPQPHVSEVTVITAPVSIGSIFGCPTDACRALADALDRGGIPSGLTNDIDKTLWAKLLYNCTLNPLSAILGTAYGGLLNSGHSVALMEELIEEVFAVMRATGHETYWPDAEAYKKEFFDTILPPTYGHRSSTLQDIERKVRTEIDSLNGAVVRMGEAAGVDTPRNTVIMQIIRSMEDLYAES